MSGRAEINSLHPRNERTVQLLHDLDFILQVLCLLLLVDSIAIEDLQSINCIIVFVATQSVDAVSTGS